MSADPLQLAAESELRGVDAALVPVGPVPVDSQLAANAALVVAATQDGDELAPALDDDDGEAERDPVLIQLIESSRDMRRRAQRVTHQDDSLQREEFVKQLGIAYADTVDPTTGMSCLDSSDADRAYYGHRDDAAYTAYRTSLLQLLDDIQWLKREKFIAESVKEDAALLEYIGLKLAATERCMTCSMTIARCKCDSSRAPGMADVGALMSQSAERANEALGRAQELAKSLAENRIPASSTRGSSVGSAATSSSAGKRGGQSASSSSLTSAEILSAARMKMITEYRESEACAERHLSEALHPTPEEERANSIRPLLARNRQAAAYKSSLMDSFRERRRAAAEDQHTQTPPRRSQSGRRVT